jgi:hypothetical protein
MCPKNPLDLIAMASINGTAGALANSTLFASETWTDVGSVLKVFTKPVVSALGTDSAQKVADAAQWNFTQVDVTPQNNRRGGIAATMQGAGDSTADNLNGEDVSSFFIRRGSGWFDTGVAR